MGQKVTIDVEARFVDNVSGEAGAASNAFKKVETNARSAAKAVDDLGKKNAAPKLDANTAKFKKAIDDSDKKLQKFGKTKAEAKLEAQDKATNVITRVLNKVKSFAGKTWSGVLKIKDYAVSGVNKVLSAVRNFAGRTWSGILKIKDSQALASIRSITSSAEKFTSKTWTAVVKIKDMATAPLRTIKNMLFSLKSLVLAITAGLAAKHLVVNPINLADQYSSAKIGFSTLLGEEAGQKMMDDLDAFAKKTPFKTSGVIGAAQKMMAMGWDSENLIADLEVLGDAAAATGNLDQGLESIVRAMSQIKTKGRLSTEELNQLAEAGIAAKAMLAEQLGYGTGDAGIAAMTEDLENGAIASDKAIAALMAGMQKYKGMMDSMANETVEGLWSQIQDTFEINVFRKWGQGLQDGAKKGFGTIIQLLDEAESALSEFGDMMYEIGKKASNWLADKFQGIVDRIMQITDTDAFKNADLGEKIAMLWKGAIADPFKEWFNELWTNEENIEKAASFGQSVAEALTKGILAFLGITDIFADTGADAESKGSNIAQGFAKGFTEGFDVSAITDKLVQAIKNVWGALPTWAQFLIGGYATGKALGGIGNFIGGVANFGTQVGNIIGSSGTMGAGNVIVGASGLLGMIGKTGQLGGVGSSGILGGLAKTGWALTGGTSALSMTGGTAALIGAAGWAGGLAGVASAGKGVYDMYGSYKAYKNGDTTEAKAKAASGGSALGGVGAGAGIGFAIGGPLGALIGAGVGGIAGWIGGNKWADNIREGATNAKFANEELSKAAVAVEKGEKSAEEFNQELAQFKLDKARECFGDIELSMEEIARLSQQIVFGKDLPKYEKFTAATQQAEASLQALKAAGQQTDRWLWKASLGVKFNEDEIESIKASFDDYINSAKAYVENKHYEFTASAELLLDLESEEGKSILKDGNAFYSKVQKELNTLDKELNKTLDKVLKDGVISAEDKVKIKIDGVEYELNEQEAVEKLQAEIARITKQIEDAEADAELVIIDLKFGEGNLTKENFDSFLALTEENLNSRLSSADAAMKAQIANLNLQFPKDKRNTEEYQKKLKTIIDSYNLEVESITADILSVELKIIGDAFSGEDMLGEDAVDDLQKILQSCLDEGIEPAEMDLSKLIELSGNPELGEDNAALIQDYLQGVFDQLDLEKYELVELDGKLQLKLKPEVEVEDGEGTEEKVKEAVDGQVPDTVNENVQVQVTPDTLIQTVETITGEDFDLPPTVSEEITLKLNAAKSVQEQIDILASEFGISEEEAETILWKLTGEKNIMNTITVTPADFGIPDSINATVGVNITGAPSYAAAGQGFRGGIFGGTGAMGSFARGGIIDDNIPGFSDGGIVRGGSQLIEVAEEGSPEMVIPLSSQRRGRALKLWAQAGNMMGVPGFARGGIIGGDGSSDEGIRFHAAEDSDSAGGGFNSQVDVGGLTVQINVTAGSNGNVADAIRAQAAEIADTVAGIMADALSGQFENTALRGGAAS